VHFVVTPPPVAAILLAVNSFRLFAIVLALAGCEHGRSSDVDAPSEPVVPDGLPPPRNDPGHGPLSQPFHATLVTPAGTFVSDHMFAHANGGDCPPTWQLEIASAPTGPGPVVTLSLSLPPYTGVEISGTRPGSASYLSPELVSYSTQNATFTGTRIDYPGDGTPRLTGRFVVTEPGWTIDLDLDLAGASTGCI